MARIARTVAPGLPHHIYARGNNRRRLVSYTTDYYFLLRCLERAIAKAACEVHQLTLMSNHLHLGATPPNAQALATLMKSCNQRYAQIRNKKRASSGKLFEERYHSKVITTDEYLRNVTLYNDANGYRAGMVDDPFDHAWSTAPIHGGAPEKSKVPLELWTPSPWYLALGRTPRQRAARYRELMYEYIARGAPEPEGAPPDGDASLRYTLRLQRPDGTSAREPHGRYVRGKKRCDSGGM